MKNIRTLVIIKRHIFPILFMLYIHPVGAQTQNEYFYKLIGPEVEFDTTITEEYLLEQPQHQILLDTNNDLIKDTIYMIDTDARHGDTRQPLLVKVVDEDGDMQETGCGDYDSDLYIADWYGDGTIDRVIDYCNLDDDDDVDEQYLYGYRNQEYYVAWAKDYGDDNRLWYDVNYEYSQLITQWKTDFNGDEMFVYWFRYDYDKNTLTPCMENAFSFYDLDNDTFSEEVVRYTGTGMVAEDLRYSMDIDNDNEFNEPYHHDYDFSVSSLGPIDLPAELCQTLTIRNIVTEPIIKWQAMRNLSKTGNWVKTHLTWDENDNNITLIPGRQYYERWEGILNHPNDWMPQIGGPSCGPFNKRNEIDQDASGKFQFYYSPIDHRLHLYGAEVGFIDVDWDYNETTDMYLFMQDKDNNGFFDTWQYDIDGDKIYETEYTIKDDSAALIPFEYEAIQAAFVPALQQHLQENELLKLALIKFITGVMGYDYIDPVNLYFNLDLVNYGPDYHLGEKIKAGKEGQRYYQDLEQIRLWQIFREQAGMLGWPYQAIEEKYRHGNFAGAAQLLEEQFKAFGVKTPASVKLYKNYPNPFRENTTINYYLPQDSHVQLTIYSILGQKVAEPVNSVQTTGFHQIKWGASSYPSGIYYCLLQAGGVKVKQKMVIIR